MRTARRAGVIALIALAGCRGTTEKDSSAFAPPPDPSAGPPREVVAAHKPWTERFTPPAVLIADEVRIEGPAPLLEHVVTRPEPELQDVHLKTVSTGLLQTITLRRGAAGEIRAQLDGLAITALRKLTVLERVGAGDVLVLAAGDAYWKVVGTGEEQRAQSLRLEGRIAR